MFCCLITILLFNYDNGFTVCRIEKYMQIYYIYCFSKEYTSVV